MVDKSKRGIVGLVLIFLIVIGDLLVGIVDSPAAPGIKTETDPLACPIANANSLQATVCEPNYCLHTVTGTVSPCLSTICISSGQRTSIFTTTSTSFVTVQASVDSSNCATTPSPSGIFVCIATFNFRVNSLTGSVSFQIFNGGVASSTYQFDDTGQAVLSSDMLGSISWADTSAQQFSTWSLQAKVSAGTITLTVLKADINCFGATGTVG